METFKICTFCDTSWHTRDVFLQDENIQLVGYQVNFEALELGLLLFNHLSCGTTMAIHAGLFRDLYNGPVFSERLTGSDECPGHCIHKEALDPCQTSCECAYIREILQSIRQWPKSESAFNQPPMTPPG